MAPRPRVNIGIHLSIGKGFAAAAREAADLGCSCLQIFVGSPRTWAKRSISDAEAEAFRDAARQGGISPVAAHATYLINLASGDAKLYEKSVSALVDEVERCALLGVPYYVIHPGNPLDAPRKGALQRVARALDKAHRAAGDAVTVCMEGTAGTGRNLGARFEELGEIRDRAKYPEAIGLCVDTCHMLAAGYDVTTAGGLAASLDELDAAFGLEGLHVVHANDSRNPLGSRKDRHEHIGRGEIGEAAFRRILKHPRLRAKPFILETPQKEPGDKQRNVDALYRLAK